MNKSHLITFLAAAALGVMWPSTASASLIFNVTVDTRTIAGLDGYLDLQFEPGPESTNLATASVTGFFSDGTLLSDAVATGDELGDVTGQLPDPLNFDNQTPFNDYFQKVMFGNTETFTVTLNGPTPLGGGPSAFNIGFWALDGITPLLTTDIADGISAQITLNPDATAAVVTFAASAESGPAVTVTPKNDGAVPEPASFALVGLSLAALLGRKRWKIHRSQA